MFSRRSFVKIKHQIVAQSYPNNHDMNNLCLHFLRRSDIHTSFSFSDHSVFRRFFFFKSSTYSNVKIHTNPYFCPTPTPGYHDLNKLESTLSEVAFTQVLAFLAQWFFRRRKCSVVNKLTIRYT